MSTTCRVIRTSQSQTQAENTFNLCRTQAVDNRKTTGVLHQAYAWLLCKPPIDEHLKLSLLDIRHGLKHGLSLEAARQYEEQTATNPAARAAASGKSPRAGASAVPETQSSSDSDIDVYLGGEPGTKPFAVPLDRVVMLLRTVGLLPPLFRQAGEELQELDGKVKPRQRRQADSAPSTAPLAPLFTLPTQKPEDGEKDDAEPKAAGRSFAALKQFKAAVTTTVMFASKRGFQPSTAASKRPGGPAFLSYLEKDSKAAAAMTPQQSAESDYWTARALQVFLGRDFFSPSAKAPPTARGLCCVTYTQFVETVNCCLLFKRLATHGSLQVRVCVTCGTVGTCTLAFCCLIFVAFDPCRVRCLVLCHPPSNRAFLRSVGFCNIILKLFIIIIRSNAAIT